DNYCYSTDTSGNGLF
nr:immunoglobulin light chain junction region [Macaca mulatta]